MNLKQIFFLFLPFIINGCSGFEKSYSSSETDRGVVALQINETNVYVGWRYLREDPEDISFNVYRIKVNDTVDNYIRVNADPIVTSTNFIDTSAVIGHGYRYRINKIIKGREMETPGEGYIFVLGTREFGEGSEHEQKLNKPYYSIRLRKNIDALKVGIGDLTGDGSYDFVIQYPAYSTDPYYRHGYWAPSPEPYKLEAYSSKGKFLWSYDMGWAIESGTWYAPYLVYDIDGDGYAEVYTKAGEGDPRELCGRVLEGPEYLVKLDGRTGKVISKTPWLSREGFAHYNYWSRNYLAAAYLDGKNPSIVIQRGTYNTIKLEALDKNFKRLWYFETTGENEKYRGQGGHSLVVADLDLDGKDELIPGTFALNSDGTPRWYTGLGHNDPIHVADINPLRHGLEIFYGIETNYFPQRGDTRVIGREAQYGIVYGSPKNGVCLVDGSTGEIIWGYEGSTFHVHGFGMAADIDPNYAGMECYGGEAKGGDKFFLFSSDGKRLSDKDIFGALSVFTLWWDDEETKELLIGNNLFKYNGDTLMNNIAGRGLMIADITGDWREEIVTALPGELRIYSTNIPSDKRKHHLLQNRQYRLGLNHCTSGYYTSPNMGIE